MRVVLLCFDPDTVDGDMLLQMWAPMLVKRLVQGIVVGRTKNVELCEGLSNVLQFCGVRELSAVARWEVLVHVLVLGKRNDNLHGGRMFVLLFVLLSRVL